MKDCANIVVGEGKRVRAAFLPNPQRSYYCPVPLPKTVRHAKVSRKPIHTWRLRDKRVPFLEAPPQQV